MLNESNSRNVLNDSLGSCTRQCGYWGFSIPNEVVEILEARRQLSTVLPDQTAEVIHVNFRDRARDTIGAPTPRSFSLPNHFNHAA